jgi:hypothetical protein
MPILRPSEIFTPNQNLRGGDMYGWIVENDDSKAKDGKKLGRVKIRVPQLHRTIPDEDLPWVFPMSEGTPGFEGDGGVGAFNVPAKGAKVRTKMDQNDPHQLRYGGSIPTENVIKNNEIRNDPDYPHVAGFVDHGGNKFRTNNKEGKTEIDYTHVSGSGFKIDNDGNVYLYSAKKLFIGAKDDVEIVSDKAVKVHGKGGNLSLKGTQILENGSDESASVKAVPARQRPQRDEKQSRVDL